MSLFSNQNIYRAYADCRKNKRNRPDALLFEMNADENLHSLRLELNERTYHPSTSACFATHKPKLREIFAADFRDRIVHHLLVRPLETIWEPVFIYDSYASRPGKGIHKAVMRLKKFMRKVSRNETFSAVYMQLDIKSFFMSIDKDILYDLICSHCNDDEILWLAHRIIYHDPTQDYRLKSPRALMKRIPRQKSLFEVENNKGLPIGNLTSQFFANVYLNGLDQFVKHTLKCRYYMRYVDDFILLADDREICEDWYARIKRYLSQTLKLELRKGRIIAPLTNGIDFLGYVVRPNYVLCRNRVVNNLKAKLEDFNRMLVKIRNNVIVIKYDDTILHRLFSSLNSYLGHFKHANTHKLVCTLFEDNQWLYHFFIYEKGKLHRRYAPPRRFANLKKQYIYLTRHLNADLIFFQTGCFYEFFDAQALNALKILRLKRIKPKYNFNLRCGIGERALNRFINVAIQKKCSAAVIRQTGYIASNVAERKLAMRYIPI